MTFGIGNLVALICIVISIIFAIAERLAIRTGRGRLAPRIPRFALKQRSDSTLIDPRGLTRREHTCHART